MVFQRGRLNVRSSRPRRRSSACRIESSSASDGLEEVSEGLQGGGRRAVGSAVVERCWPKSLRSGI